MRDEEIFEKNQRSWNSITAAHNSHKRDQASFFSKGGSTLREEELTLLAGLLREGTKVVHLMCNCGQDSLSLAQEGASVTGVDFCTKAVSFARALSAESGVEAEFVESEVGAFLEDKGHAGRFDIAFASYGFMGWLPDLTRWLKGVGRILKPSGKLIMVEFHPLLWSFSDTGKVTTSYFIDGPIEEDGVTDYVGSSGASLAPMGFEKGVSGFENSNRSICFQWTVADIVQGLVDAGFSIERLVEYPYTTGYRHMESQPELPGGRFGMVAGLPALPLMLGLRARRSP